MIRPLSNVPLRSRCCVYGTNPLMHWLANGAYKHWFTNTGIPRTCACMRVFAHRRALVRGTGQAGVMSCFHFLCAGSEVSARGMGRCVSECEDGLQMEEICGWTVALWCGWARPERCCLSSSRFHVGRLAPGAPFECGCPSAHAKWSRRRNFWQWRSNRRLLYVVSL